MPCPIRIALHGFDRPRTSILDNIGKAKRACPMLSVYGDGENVAEIIPVNVFLPNRCLVNQPAPDIDYDIVRKLPQRIRASPPSTAPTYSGIV